MPTDFVFDYPVYMLVDGVCPAPQERLEFRRCLAIDTTDAKDCIALFSTRELADAWQIFAASAGNWQPFAIYQSLSEVILEAELQGVKHVVWDAPGVSFYVQRVMSTRELMEFLRPELGAC